MIKKINQLKTQTASPKVKSLCELAVAGLTSPIYNNVTPGAKYEIENITVKGLFESLSSIELPEVKKWLSTQKRLWAVKNLGVNESVNMLLQTEAKVNSALKETLDYYRESIESGVPEIKLYESFISAMQSFNYFPKVGNAIKAIEDQVNTYSSDVSITKILETMKETMSAYLIPLIEDVVQNYLDDKNTQNKSFLKEALIKYSYDPFIRDLINLVTLDATELQLEYANSQCDIEKVYSPILYLGENEAIFGVRGLFYMKKGNTVSRLNETDVKRLNSDFVSLCEMINSPNIVIDSKSVTVYEGTDKAIISENNIIINNKEISLSEWAETTKIGEWAGKSNFLRIVETISANFNEIAEIDFAKRVYLKEDQNHAADVFKLRGNVFISTHDTTSGKNTFYRNINPIQAKGIMMEHLRYDVSRLFEGLLPESEKIMEEIFETKKEYEDYIALLENKISEFGLIPYNTEINTKVIEALEEELQEVKNDYKDYLNIAERYTRPLKEDITITVDVDGKKYTVPIPGNGQQVTSPGAEPSDTENKEAGTEVGDENMDKQPASAITFRDDQTELLGDTPSIKDDNVDLGADKAEAEADKAEAESKSKEGGEEGEEEGGEEKSKESTEKEPENKEEDSLDLEGGEEDKIKIDGEADTDEEDEENKEKKTEESSEAKTSIKTEVPKKRKVFLKRKKS